MSHSAPRGKGVLHNINPPAGWWEGLSGYRKIYN
jgi:hypothetical protein